MAKDKKVNDKTRAGAEGKMIYCPLCTNAVKVYHFDWTAILCANCKMPVNKTDWVLR